MLVMRNQTDPAGYLTRDQPRQGTTKVESEASAAELNVEYMLNSNEHTLRKRGSLDSVGR